MTLSDHIAILMDLLARLDAVGPHGAGTTQAEDAGRLRRRIVAELRHLNEIGALAHIRDLLTREEAVIRRNRTSGGTT